MKAASPEELRRAAAHRLHHEVPAYSLTTRTKVNENVFDAYFREWTEEIGWR